ncbi:Rabankyrin-5 [Phytophthora citrophthora]|uniref:Rabankyrin-5 n=1 Tax=Phytophthora citrophthora TaxID=4793 RepID=A0AAD9GNL9_9STRA|nr:Rabankyrin-5 [Phytophthora citrophthora]KAK1941935.1 Rabankyrin-5 [Phytophthora citrophthora]
MPAAEVDIDNLRTDYAPHSPGLKTAQPNSSNSRSTSSASYKAYSMGDEEEIDDARDTYQQPPISAPNRGESFDYRRVQQASSFDVQDMINMRESNFRDSLMPGTGYNEPGSNHDSGSNSGGRPTEMGNALMRMDESYRRAYNNQRPSVSGTTPDGLTPLLQAARAGDIVLVNALVIQAGTDILRRDPMFGQTALHFAIRGGHLNVVQALLMPQLRGSIVNVADNRRNTALHLAAAKSRRMTKLLLECGADVNFLNMRNQTPLGVHILTVTRDDPTLTEILLQHRANANAPVDKSTILHVALDKGLIQVATRLVRHGARLDLKDESGKTVFDKVDKAQLKMLMAKVAHPPVWVPDSERVECMECRKKFGSLGTRRHHCRMCGRVLCSACSACHLRAKKLPFPARRRGKKNKAEKGSANTRVCNMCNEICTEGDLQSNNAGFGTRAHSETA